MFSPFFMFNIPKLLCFAFFADAMRYGKPIATSQSKTKPHETVMPTAYSYDNDKELLSPRS
jgi:hypothetical protein